MAKRNTSVYFCVPVQGFSPFRAQVQKDFLEKSSRTLTPTKYQGRVLFALRKRLALFAPSRLLFRPSMSGAAYSVQVPYAGVSDFAQVVVQTSKIEPRYRWIRIKGREQPVSRSRISHCGPSSRELLASSSIIFSQRVSFSTYFTFSY